MQMQKSHQHNTHGKMQDPSVGLLWTQIGVTNALFFACGVEDASTQISPQEADNGRM